MAIPVQLMPGWVLITVTDSTLGIAPRTDGLQFGVIAQLFDDTPQNVSLAQYVMFDESEAKLIVYSSNQYLLIKEDKIIFRELAAP